MHQTTHVRVTLPGELIDQVDRLVGRRHRSRFLADAVAKEVRRRRRLEPARAVAGSLADVDIPGWETSESAAAWVRDLRAGKIRGSSESIDRPDA